MQHLRFDELANRYLLESAHLTNHLALSVLEGIHLYDENAHIIFPSTSQCRLQKCLSGLCWTRHARGQDGGNLLIAYHFPESIGTEQESITDSEWYGTGFHLHTRFLAQTAIDEIAPGVGIDVFWLDNPCCYKSCDE